MARASEQQIINTLATYEAAIDGVTTSYGFAANPDVLPRAELPAVAHIVPRFNMSLFAHHNVHRTEFVITSILYVASREDYGGRLKFLENAAIPLMMRWRQKFQEEATITALLNLGLHRAFDLQGEYGAGGRLLTHNGVEYVGAVFTYNFVEAG